MTDYISHLFFNQSLMSLILDHSTLAYSRLLHQRNQLDVAFHEAANVLLSEKL